MEEMTRRMARFLLAALPGLCGVVQGSETDELDALISEFEDFEVIPDWVLEKPRWLVLTTLRAGTGYRDNVLLSEFREQGGGFLSAGADLVVINPSESGLGFTLLLSGDNLHFPGKREFPDERFAMIHTRLEMPVAEVSRLIVGGDAYYTRKRIDVSTVETLDWNLEAVDMIGGGAGANAGWRREFGNQINLMAEFSAGHHWFREPLDDYREMGPKLTMGWQPGPERQWTVTMEQVRRDYRTREAREANGDPRVGSDLRFDITRGNLSHRRQWRPEWGRVTAVSRAGVELNRDNGGRYFDHTRWRAGQRLEWMFGEWWLRGQVELSYFEYDKQIAVAGGSSPRRRLPWSYELEAGRKLTESLRIHLRYHREAASTNQNEGNYRVNTISTGLEWEL